MSARKTKNSSRNDEPEKKRLRSSDADLKITVGKGENKMVLWEHSQVMATHSKYIDTMLASPMKESKTLEISFPDISPEHWNLMMHYLSPVHSCNMTIDHAQLLVEMYDQYEFADGMAVCDIPLSKIFCEIDYYKSTDEKVKTLVLAHNLNLERTKECGAAWIHQMIKDGQHEKMDFTVEHVRQLAPFIAESDSLSNLMLDFVGISDREEIKNPMLPAYFVSQIQLIVARNTAQKCMVRIEVANCDAEGSYVANGDKTIGDSCSYHHPYNACFEISKREGENWAIYRNVPSRVLLYTCKNSRFATVPPQKGWSKEILVEGGPSKQESVNLRLGYVYTENKRLRY